MIKCGHKFCKHCIEKSLRYSPQCPICKVFLRPAVGNQPIDGKMDVQVCHWFSAIHVHIQQDVHTGSSIRLPTWVQTVQYNLHYILLIS